MVIPIKTQYEFSFPSGQVKKSPSLWNYQYKLFLRKSSLTMTYALDFSGLFSKSTISLMAWKKLKHLVWHCDKWPCLCKSPSNLTLNSDLEKSAECQQDISQLEVFFDQINNCTFINLSQTFFPPNWNSHN